MIIGITGTLAAGKGTVVDFLKERGFKHYSVREYLTEEIKRRGMALNRDSMVIVANDLREKYSPSYIAEKLYEIAEKKGGNCIIESLRTPGEVMSLKNKKEFYLFAIDANVGIRYLRAKERNSETDKIDFETFKVNEEREWANSDPTKGNIKKCIEMADYKFENNETLEKLKEQVEKILEEIENKKIQEKYIRPSWDEYFMEIVQAVSTRATCGRGRSGCIIVRDKQILVTGYVGAPVGLPHCDEVGHQMKKTIHEDGHISNHCVRTTHAEQNAICQAAKLGVSINGATVYCKMTPCSVCAKLIINSGIKRVVCEKKYHAGAESEEMFRVAGIKLDILNNEIEKY